ncbi:hydrolase [Halobacteriales archaeon Cl-PHB]
MLEEWRATDVGRGEPGDRPVSVPGKPKDLAGTDAVRYVTTIDDPRADDEDVAVLHLEGVYAHADVEITGEILGQDGPVTHDAYFEPLRIPFRPAEDGETRIAVTCEAPSDRFGGLHDTDRVPEAERIPGIWWEARVETHSLPFVDDVQVRPELTSEGAVLHVKSTVVTDGPLEDRLTYSLKPAGELKTRGMMDRGKIEATGPGKTVGEHTIDVRDPSLWWPRGYGEQHRYTLRAKFADTEKSVTTGICHVKREGSQLVVNGEAVAIRGVNLVTADVEDVDRALDVNANLLRAHSQVLPPEVYEAADEAGLLVWQDLPLTGPEEFDVDQGQAVAEGVAGAVGHHPSIAAYGVHDEPTDTYAEGLGSGLLDGLRLRWRAWRSSYDPDPAKRVAEALPDSRPAFPVVGGPDVAGDAAAYYPGWDYGEAASIETLLSRYPADVVAEFGAGALTEWADEKTIDDVADFDASKHDAHVEDDVEGSQAYQAEVVAAVAEHLRRAEVGAVAYALRDTDVAGMGVVGVDGRTKTATAALARAFEPLQAFLADPGTGSSEVLVVNDSRDPATGELAWEAGEESGTLDVDLAAGGRETVGEVTVPGDAESIVLRLETGERAVENRYDL